MHRSRALRNKQYTFFITYQDNASQVAISLTNGADKLILTIRNNGLPFPDLRGHSTGMGLRIMSYRASLIGASLEIKSADSRGTRVTCSVPLEEKK